LMDTAEWFADQRAICQTCQRWSGTRLKATRVFLETMIMAIHIAYDQSARAEELAMMMIKN